MDFINLNSPQFTIQIPESINSILYSEAATSGLEIICGTIWGPHIILQSNWIDWDHLPACTAVLVRLI